ncbi:hypothetical protein IAU59_001130 [Kwoniella sp. CBS 9459]
MVRKQTTVSSDEYAADLTPLSTSTSASTSAPNSAAGGGGDRDSQPFFYSTARPPTGFSEVDTAWSTSDPSSTSANTRNRSSTSGSKRTPPPVPRSGGPGRTVHARVTSNSRKGLTPRARHGNTTPNPFVGGEGDNDDGDGDVEESLDDLVDRKRSTNENGDEDGDGAYTSDLYQRSDWAQSARTSQLPTAWSRSSYAGKTPRVTGHNEFFLNEDEVEIPIPPLPSPYDTRHGKDGQQRPVRNYSRKHTKKGTTAAGAVAGAQTPKHVQYAHEQDVVMDSPAELTPGTGLGLGLGLKKKMNGGVTPKSALKHSAMRTPKTALTPASTGLTTSSVITTQEVGSVDPNRRQSTLPSVLDLHHLVPPRHQAGYSLNHLNSPNPVQPTSRSPSLSPAASRAHFTGQIRAPSPSRSISPAPSSGLLLPPGQSQSPGAVLRPNRDPFADPQLHPNAHSYGHGRTVDHDDAYSPALDFSKPRYISPEDQSRLGRMSVAPPPGPNPHNALDAMPSRNGNQPVGQSEPRALLSPAAQNRLGRMSVAPARYTLPPQRRQVRLARNSAIDGEAEASAYDRTITPGLSLRGPTAAHSDPPRSRAHTPVTRSHDHQTSDHAITSGVSHKFKHSTIGRWYLTWRPFISPCLFLLSALLLTISHGVSDSHLGGFVKVYNGVFGVSRGGEVPIVLGVWGWCQDVVNEPECARYTSNDFANDAATFTIPGNSTLNHLSSVLTALTVLCWLQAAFQTVTAFLHFYLFFALSIPFSHLINATTGLSPDQPKLNGGVNTATARDREKSSSPNQDQQEQQRDPVMVEVEMRVKCQRVPYEGYEWVWWAWWAHRRGPVGPLFGLLTGALAIGTFALAYMLKKDIIQATGSEEVFLYYGGYLPLLVVSLTLHTFISSVIYALKLKRNLATITSPPDPSPAVLLLPPSDARQMQHVRPYTNAASIFVPRDVRGVDPQLLTNTRDTYLHPNTPALPSGAAGYGTAVTRGKPELPMGLGMAGEGGQSGSGNGDCHGEQYGLDEETVRWLAAYPTDEELVPLINSLRAKASTPPSNADANANAIDEESDFILSDVGLLYLRPSTDDPEEQALLVPPRGVIRLELVEDAHLDPVVEPSPYVSKSDNGPAAAAAAAAHNSAEAMMDVLGKTFWWNDMYLDIEDYIASCRVCRERREEQRLKDKYEYQSKYKRKSTPPQSSSSIDAQVEPWGQAQAQSQSRNQKGDGHGHSGEEAPWTGIATASDIGERAGGSQARERRGQAAAAAAAPGSHDRRQSPSQMAAEMAFAMRKAQEDAERV